MFDSPLEIDVAFENIFDDEEPLDVAERTTLLPGFDLARFAHEAMFDVESDDSTLEIPHQKLTALVSKSIPPTCVVGIEQFVHVTTPTHPTHAFSPYATHLISLIDGTASLAAIVMRSGLTQGEALGALRELYEESAISMCA